MPIYRKTKLADAVLSSVEWLMDSEQEYWLEPYQNGREHGHSLIKGDKQVAFSEFRRSDNIVVYIGGTLRFDMAGNVPSEDVYENKKFFSYDEITEAARYIIEFLES